MRRFAALLAVFLVSTACASAGTPTAESGRALFYAKDGAIYISEPAGSPGRKLTDGPHDTEPAAAPDGNRVAFVRKSDPAQPGGELWVLDVASGQTRRLIDPAALVPAFEGDLRQVSTPRWSPTGDRIAFLRSTYGGGGALLTAAADSGAVQTPRTQMFAGWGYAWAPDGRHIAWVQGRSDVRAVDVAVFTIGGSSVPVAKDTNAFAAGYAVDGSVLFSNGYVDERMFTGDIPFALRQGGIYSVRPPSGPQPLITGASWFSDVAGLPSGAVGFTENSADYKTKTIKVLDRAGGSPRTVAETDGASPGPVWADDTVAYIGIGDDQQLLVKQGDSEARRIDTGVDSFAWGG